MPDDAIDWEDAGRKFMQIEADLFHGEGTQLHGGEFYAEVLRRLWARIGHQFITASEHMRVLEANRFVDRANGIQAEATLKYEREKFQRQIREAGTEFAGMLRARVNERSVPSVYRREGVLLAADWLDGGAGKGELS